MAQTTTPVANEQYVQYSEKMWHNFAKGVAIALAHAIVILLILAATLL